jgi:hypothetical protein
MTAPRDNNRKAMMKLIAVRLMRMGLTFEMFRVGLLTQGRAFSVAWRRKKNSFRSDLSTELN